MEIIDKYLGKVIRLKFIQHLLFWSLSFLVLLNIFAYDAVFYLIDFLFTALFHLCLLISVYVNIRVLIPVFLNQQNYIKYALGFLMTLIVAIIINEVVMNDFSKWLFPDYYFISAYGWEKTALIILTYLALSTLLKISKSWFQLKRTEQKLEQVKQESLQRELNLLRAQVNPHFLFNSLNSIYSLILDQQPQSADAVLKLSEVLRYALYQSRQERVPLPEELAQLHQYIELEQLRAEEADIRLMIEGDPSPHTIAPLLLLPLVENGFKHGIKGDIENLFLHISIYIEADSLICKVVNNKGEASLLLPEAEGGIGLTNLKRRLDLTYSDRYLLEIKEEKEQFSVILKIMPL